MSDLNAVLSDARSAVADLGAAAEATGSSWLTPRAPGKWSPSQIVEHVARAFDGSAKELAGVPSDFPKFPSFVRPLVRALFFDRVLKKGAMPKAKTNKAMNPQAGAPTANEGRARLEEAFARFEQACLAVENPRVVSGIFGSVSIEDYVRFQQIHTRHHLAQMGVASIIR